MSGTGCILRRTRHVRGTQPGVGCQHAVKADQMQARTRHQRGQALHEFQRRRDDVRGAVSVHSADTLGELAVKSGISPRLALTVGEFNEKMTQPCFGSNSPSAYKVFCGKRSSG